MRSESSQSICNNGLAHFQCKTEFTSAIHVIYDIYLSSADIEEDLMHSVDALCGCFNEELPQNTAKNFAAN